jgi:hypothetical protein
MCWEQPEPRECSTASTPSTSAEDLLDAAPRKTLDGRAMTAAALALAAILAAQPAPSPHRNYAMTPGAITAATTEQVCKPGYATSVRPSSSVAPAQDGPHEAYGIAGGRSSAYQLDHVVSLELGGAPTSLRNLWPEPIEVARQKDKVENALHTAVCSGLLPLWKAQACEAFNWHLCVTWYLSERS